MRSSSSDVGLSTKQMLMTVFDVKETQHSTQGLYCQIRHFHLFMTCAHLFWQNNQRPRPVSKATKYSDTGGLLMRADVVFSKREVEGAPLKGVAPSWDELTNEEWLNKQCTRETYTSYTCITDMFSATILGV